MAWRFRKSFSPIPGVRLTFSPRGITTSVGVGPLRLTSGSNGVAFTTRIPDTGLSFRQPLTLRSVPSSLPASSPIFDPGLRDVFPTLIPALPATLAPQLQEIKSAGSAILTSAGLTAFKETLAQAQHQHASVQDDLANAQQVEMRDVDRYRNWANGWFFRRLMKQRYAELQAKAAEAQALRCELQEQLELSRMHTQFEMSDDVAKACARLCEDFGACSHSQRVCDNVAHLAANQVAERTIAGRIVDLKPVRFSLGQCGVIEAPMPLPCLQNANGGDIYLYPGFMVYHASATNYALIETSDVELKVQRMRFHEEQSVPSDATQVGSTWAKTNKDGSQDRRFKDNYQIPVMQYARLTLQSSSGLNEEYILSNVEATEKFELAWLALRDAVRRGT